MKAPGKGLLKVSGILLIIFGGIELLLGVLAAVGMLIPGVLETAAAAAGTSATMVMMGAVILVVLGALYLIAGILGVKNCDKLEKAQVCFVVGVIMILVALVNSILAAVGGNLKWYNIILEFTLPIIYLLGALKNKEASGAGVETISEEAVDTDK